MNCSNYIFIYGSLKRGFHNHVFMEDTHFVRNAVTKHAVFSMHPTEYFFPVVYRGIYRIAGELYKVDQDTLASLDKLEGNGTTYTRTLVDIEGIPEAAWMYLYNYGNDYKSPAGLDILVETKNGVQTWLRPEDYFEFSEEIE